MDVTNMITHSPAKAQPPRPRVTSFAFVCDRCGYTLRHGDYTDLDGTRYLESQYQAGCICGGRYAFRSIREQYEADGVYYCLTVQRYMMTADCPTPTCWAKTCHLAEAMAGKIEVNPPRSRFTDFDSLIKTACPTCGADWEVIPIAGSYFARCVSPACEGHGMLHPIGRRLAQAWEAFVQALDQDYQSAEEEALCNQ